VDEVIDRLQRHKRRHSEEHYYAVRAKVPRELPERAARIIYLNKTCYNGLYRENSKGLFNAPFGRYKNPVICDEENLRAVSKALKKARIESRHFQTVVEAAKPGDLVYFDPPYYPVSKTASFQGYHHGAFGEDSQRLLAEVFAKLAANDVHVLLSNSMTDFILMLYRDFSIDTVQATRAVNSRADKRGKVAEALVRSF
jgi:DNA adenine methylase